VFGGRQVDKVAGRAARVKRLVTLGAGQAVIAYTAVAVDQLDALPGLDGREIATGAGVVRQQPDDPMLGGGAEDCSLVFLFGDPVVIAGGLLIDAKRQDAIHKNTNQLVGSAAGGDDGIDEIVEVVDVIRLDVHRFDHGAGAGRLELRDGGCGHKRLRFDHRRGLFSDRQRGCQASILRAGGFGWLERLGSQVCRLGKLRGAGGRHDTGGYGGDNPQKQHNGHAGCCQDETMTWTLHEMNLDKILPVRTAGRHCF